MKHARRRIALDDFSFKITDRIKGVSHTHQDVKKKRQQFKANVNADVAPATRPQHVQNQFSRNICKTSRKSAEMLKLDTLNA